MASNYAMFIKYVNMPDLSQGRPLPIYQSKRGVLY